MWNRASVAEAVVVSEYCGYIGNTISRSTPWAIIPPTTSPSGGVPDCVLYPARAIAIATCRSTDRGPLLLLALRAFLGRLLFGDVAGVLERRRLLGVQLDVARPLSRGVGLGEDRLDRALGDARLAVDAVVRVDVEHLLVHVEALH